MKNLARIRGFTLTELMVTLAIAAILAAIAAPGFQNTIRDNRVATNANNLIASLTLARSEAIKRGIQVTLKRKGGNSRNWDSGWDLFTDFDADGDFDTDNDANLCEVNEDCLLKTFAALPSGYTLRTSASYADWLAYRPDGLSRSGGGAGNDTFRLCTDLADTNTSRAIIISNTGRPRIETGTAQCP